MKSMTIASWESVSLPVTVSTSLLYFCIKKGKRNESATKDYILRPYVSSGVKSR